MGAPSATAIEPRVAPSPRPTGYVVLTPPTMLDLSTAPRFREELLAHSTDHEIVIDLANVTFCDSTGISALIAGLHHVAAGDGHITLRRPTGAVRRVLDMTQVSPLFVIESE